MILSSKRHSCGEKLWSQKSCSKLLRQVDPDFNSSFLIFVDELWLWTSTQSTPGGHVRWFLLATKLVDRIINLQIWKWFIHIYTTYLYLIFNLWICIACMSGQDWWFLSSHPLGPPHHVPIIQQHVFSVFIILDGSIPGFRQSHHTWDEHCIQPSGEWSRKLWEFESWHAGLVPDWWH